MTLVKELTFLQGDDAREIFELLYPKGGVRMIRDPRIVVRYLLDFVPEDAEPAVTEFDDYGYSGRVNTKDHILVWNFAHCWVALYLRVTKKSLKTKQLVDA